jgi:hypothetical protein
LFAASASMSMTVLKNLLPEMPNHTASGVCAAR